MFGSRKHPRSAPGYLVRPRLGALRSAYSAKPLAAPCGMLGEKRKKSKKPSSPKMDWRVKHPTYVDIAYRESVERLRVMLAESYTPSRRSMRELDSAGEETDNQSQLSFGSRGSRLGKGYYSYLYNPVTPRKYYYPSRNYTVGTATTEKNMQDPLKAEPSTGPPELMSFIERQEEYIEQLEKESNFCREELSTLLNKVKDVISENENLHERQKSKLIKSVFDHLETETETETETEPRKVSKSPKKSKRSTLEGPPIVFESRISELEAQLTQAKIDLKKAQDENETLRRKINDGTLLESAGYESYKKQIDALQKEKDALQETVRQLQNTLALFKGKENDTVDKVKRSLEIAEQAQYEKTAAEAEIRRLKDELERQHSKLRDAITDQSRRIADERSAAERRYTQQIEQLTAELGVQWESTNKLQLEMDKQRRENSDLRREVAQKQALIDGLKKDMQSKIINLQSDIGATGAEKSALEQQIATLQMANERTERQYKQEITRLETEVQSFRQRLDRADADLIHSRRENLRLNEQIASLEKEIALNAAISDERTKTPRTIDAIALPPPKTDTHDREKELTSMLRDMESKHASTVAELEQMIYSQNQLMDKLSNECQALTHKLEEASVRHKEEIQQLHTNLEYLNDKFIQSQFSSSSMQDKGHPAEGDRGNARRTPPLASRLEQPVKMSPQKERQTLNKTQSSPRSNQALSRQNSRDKTNMPSSPLPEHSKQSPPEQQYSKDNRESPQLYGQNSNGRNESKTYNQSLPRQSTPSAQKAKSPEADYDPEQQSAVPYSTTQSEYDTGQQIQEQYDDSRYNQSTAQYTTAQYDDSQPIPSEYDQSQEQFDPNQAQYDPNQQYVQGAEEYDPNQQYEGYDPNQYDPNQTYDPNQYDPNQYEPTQQYQQYEGEQQYQEEQYVKGEDYQNQGDITIVSEANQAAKP